jgi:hypothetical protein
MADTFRHGFPFEFDHCNSHELTNVLQSSGKTHSTQFFFISYRK